MRMTQLLIRSLMLLLAAWKSLATDGESNPQSGNMVEAIEPSESAQKIGGGASMPPSGNFESEDDFSGTEIDVESREGERISKRTSCNNHNWLSNVPCFYFIG